MENLFHRSTQPVVQWLLAFVGACLPIYIVTVGTHWLMGTQELLTTLLPVLGCGTLYCGLYSSALLGAQRRSHQSKEENDEGISARAF